MINQGDVISYLEMCKEVGVNLQKGMNFRLRGSCSLILMSVRKGAPYADRVENDGRVLIYEGHDIPRTRGGADPKSVDQALSNPKGGLNQNGLFYKAATDYKAGNRSPEIARVFEKIRDGIWVYSGMFKLIDAWQEESGGRSVIKFKMELVGDQGGDGKTGEDLLGYDRIIPTSVKLAVWKRDKGRCVICGSKDNLHFDHIIPFSKGGSSLVAENIQILCARHNIAKKDKIE